MLVAEDWTGRVEPDGEVVVEEAVELRPLGIRPGDPWYPDPASSENFTPAGEPVPAHTRPGAPFA
ncbi:MAG: hypothetical protein ACJ72W_13795, partial [Actinoallomurus sp.]